MSEFVNTRTTLGDQATLDALVANSLSELKEDGAKTLGQRALYKNTGLTSIDLPSVTATGQYAISDCTNLESVSMDSVETLGNYTLSGCSSLATVELPKAKTINGYVFQNSPCGVIELPKATSLQTYVGTGNGPSGFDFTEKLTIPNSAFYNDANLSHLILRSEQVCPLSGTGAFTGTPLSIGVGWIYVPSSLVDTYKATSNWSIYSSQIVPITAYPKAATGTITDTWPEIAANIENGTYSSKYTVGNTRVFQIDGVNWLAKLTAMDADTLASDTTKTAATTWTCMGILENKRMNATNTTSGGWAETELRAYLHETVLPKIESAVRTNIKEVKKTYRCKSPTDTTLSSDDYLWLLSYREVGFTNSNYIEDSGPIYSSIFDSNNNRIRKMGPLGLGSASYWWLRSAYNTYIFSGVHNNGNENGIGAYNSGGIVFGFCI